MQHQELLFIPAAVMATKLARELTKPQPQLPSTPPEPPKQVWTDTARDQVRDRIFERAIAEGWSREKVESMLSYVDAKHN